MAIRAIIGFEHLPQNVTNWVNFVTHGIYRGNDSSVYSVITNGWIVDKDTGGSAFRISIPLAPYMQAPVNKIWFGFRLRLRANPNGAAGIVYLNNTYLLIINEIPGVAIGGVYHVEFSYDITTGTIERWVNGVSIGLSARSPGAGLRDLTLGLEGKGSVSAQIDWRDINVCDDQGVSQGLPIGPLGPRDIVPITMDQATGSDWATTPNGTPLLTAISEVGDPTAKYATSDINSKGQLVASMAASIPAGKNVTAIELIATTMSNGTSTVTNATKLRKGTDEVDAKFITAPAGAWNFNANLGIFHKAPGGQQWSNATIDSTSIVLTPDV